ncbi:hypothetical protein BDSB_29065 [Burkholderia dolosa PC543]|nr:hypothetical protein BDSB_29065 [Burkholderia dolosa PC543]
MSPVRARMRTFAARIDGTALADRCSATSVNCEEGMPMKHDPALSLHRPDPPMPDIDPDPAPSAPDVPPDLPEPYRHPEGDPPEHRPPEREPPAEPPAHVPPPSAVRAAQPRQPEDRR